MCAPLAMLSAHAWGLAVCAMQKGKELNNARAKFDHMAWAKHHGLEGPPVAVLSFRSQHEQPEEAAAAPAGAS